MQDVSAPKSLQAFQISYGKYLRNPDGSVLPEGIPQRRSEIYEGLLFNNISGFINNCFPVTRSLHSSDDWKKLIRSFFKDWRCTTPIFSQLPFEFVRYCSETLIVDTLPAWMPELLHYEWVELEVDVKANEDEQSDASVVQLNTSTALLAYNWPVHTISSKSIPDEASQTFLVVYRNEECKVRFLEINATTYMLLQQIQDAPDKINNVIASFVDTLNHPDPEALEGFTLQVMQDLKEKEILLGDF